MGLTSNERFRALSVEVLYESEWRCERIRKALPELAVDERGDLEVIAGIVRALVSVLGEVNTNLNALSDQVALLMELKS